MSHVCIPDQSLCIDHHSNTAVLLCLFSSGAYVNVNEAGRVWYYWGMKTLEFTLCQMMCQTWIRIFCCCIFSLCRVWLPNKRILISHVANFFSHRIRAIQRGIVKQEKESAERQARRRAKKEKLVYSTRRLHSQKYSPAEPEVLLTSELQGSLRLTKVTTSPTPPAKRWQLLIRLYLSLTECLNGF